MERTRRQPMFLKERWILLLLLLLVNYLLHGAGSFLRS
jgi:hypothetical protein